MEKVSWGGFLRDFARYNSGDCLYGEVNHLNALWEKGSNGRRLIARFLDEGLDPQTGLKEFVKCSITHCRYFNDAPLADVPYIRMFLEKGAVFDPDWVLKPHYEEGTAYLEDEAMGHGLSLRALLYCVFLNSTPLPPGKAVYWEEVKGKDGGMYPMNTHENYIAALKYEIQRTKTSFQFYGCPWYEPKGKDGGEEEE